MPFKCCVYNCNSNYSTCSEKVTVFRFPDDDSERQRWICSLPNANFEYTSSKRICINHWPEGFRYKTVRGGAKVPLDPPSIFDVPKSCIPSVSLPRKLSHPAETRNQLPDEMDIFQKYDKLTSLSDMAAFLKSEFKDSFNIVETSSKLVVTSRDYVGAVSKFTIFATLHDSPGAFEMEYYSEIEKLYVPFLKRYISSRSELENAVRYVLNYESGGTKQKKRSFISRQIELLNNSIGTPYTISDLTTAMDISSHSRSAYNKLRHYLTLPSLRLLQTLTGKIDRTTDHDFLSHMFKDLKSMQKWCQIIIDEVYVKPGFQYSGGVVYGASTRDSKEKANTVLAVMIQSLCGGPKFVYKLYPIHKLDCSFQCTVIRDTVRILKESGAIPLVVIMDNNKTNQSTFTSLSDGDPLSHVMAREDPPIFLINDTVHILKTIRNNWLTEKQQRLLYKLPDDDTERTADWKLLRKMLDSDGNSIIKSSKLTKAAVFPRPVERQNVSLVLKVFCDETAAALRNKFGENDTVLFIEFITKWWKIVNVKQKGLEVRLRDPFREAITGVECRSLDFLKNQMIPFINFLTPENFKCRKMTLTIDTSKAIKRTCAGLVAISEHLLALDFSYVLLGHFQSDVIERQFGKYRQGSGGTYLITVQNIVQKFRIDNARKYLRTLTEDQYRNIAESSDSHTCPQCQSQDLDFDDFYPVPDIKVSRDVLESLCYISGYVCTKIPELTDYLEENDSYDIYMADGSLIDILDRGGLTKPTDSVCEFVIECYKVFCVLQEANKATCRTICIDIFRQINIRTKLLPVKVDRVARILANIFLNNLSKRKTEELMDNTHKIKLAKLSTKQ